MGTQPLYVGIDVAKASLDVAVHPTAERWTIAYTERELAGRVPRLTTLPPALVVLEPPAAWRGPSSGRWPRRGSRSSW